MCGIFGLVSEQPIPASLLRKISLLSQRRGRDSSGLVYYLAGGYVVTRADVKLATLERNTDLTTTTSILGHSRLITNGSEDNQPVIGREAIVLHNGILVDVETSWQSIGKEPALEIDTELIAEIASLHIEREKPVASLAQAILAGTRGTVSAAVLVPSIGKLVLLSNNGSLYLGRVAEGITVFASEKYTLKQLEASDIEQVYEGVIIDVPQSNALPSVHDQRLIGRNLVPSLGTNLTEEKLLVYPEEKLKRCSKCILPGSMPFIAFDQDGVCNYCLNYKPRNHPRPVEELFDLVEHYRRDHGADALVPFSGGRDSCYGLHLVVNELKMKPITFTYDWGMVTDLGRRNISRMCAQLGVENIIVADDISKKRDYIRMNLSAWLKSPHLGMLSLLTAGDKHFFRYIQTIQKETGISLNLWGINPLEVTHFKAGFLGVPPDFAEERVYSHGLAKQLRYQQLRLRQMVNSLGYFNTSIWDTISGEYYRSAKQKTDYFHIFDFWRWDENEINDCLINTYDWEVAADTPTTWRIGDGTAAFYNYVYRTVAGFTEHDTFRSNQIREGDLSREEALSLVEVENAPRYPNIKWYLDTVNIDFEHAIRIVNEIPRMY